MSQEGELFSVSTLLFFEEKSVTGFG